MVKNIDSGGKVKMFKPNIKYEYIVDGVKYYNDGDNVYNFRHYYGKIKNAQNYLEKYIIGKNIDVMYNKNNPDNSMIKNQVYEMNLFMIMLSLSFLLIGIIGLLIIIKTGK